MNAKNSDIQSVAETLHVQAVVPERDGSTRFVDEEVSLDYGTGQLRLSAPINAIAMGFNRIVERSETALSPSSFRQLVLVTEGELEVTTSDGETRLFRPSDILSLRDTFGNGHRERVTAGRPFRSAIVALDGPAKADGRSPPDATNRDGLDYIHNQANEQELSYFERKRLPYVRNSAERAETAWLPLSAFQYVLAPSDLDLPWHRAPRRQIVLVLTGGLQMQYGDGSKATVPPGGFLIGEDTSGQGHITRALDGAERLSLFAHLG